MPGATLWPVYHTRLDDPLRPSRILTGHAGFLVSISRRYSTVALRGNLHFSYECNPEQPSSPLRDLADKVPQDGTALKSSGSNL